MAGTILNAILAHKRSEVAARKAQRGRRELIEHIQGLPPARGFAGALNAAIAAGGDAVIAEVKKASPSKGVIRPDFDPTGIAASYARAGATCLSVLTDEKYFQGADRYLTDIRTAVDLPLLRKDFIVDDYQIPESRLIGADCILLIVAALGRTELKDLRDLAIEIGLDVLMEVHDQAELEAALPLSPSLIGINNRNLKTFETSLDSTYRLLPLIPNDVLVVTESGIHTPEHVQAMRDHGVHAFLVGEAFMKASDPGTALRHLFC